jgi:hypothetical protein
MQHFPRNALLLCALSIVTTLVAPASAQQQPEAGTVSGTVVATAGAPVQNATIVLENVATGARMQTTSDSSGNYKFENVPSGTYRMTASTAQYSGTPSEDIIVDATRAKIVNITMQTGAGAAPTTTALITVEEGTPGHDLSVAPPQIRTNWNTRDIQYLPEPLLVERNGDFYGAYNLSLFNAGVAPNYGIGPAVGPVVGGQRPISNNWLIEGQDNNNRALPRPLVNTANEGVSEMAAFQNQFAPEYGHTMGGQFNEIARPGTNRPHGELFWYLQNRNLNAMDQRLAAQGYDFPAYDQNRVGANLGVPFYNNNLFFFGNFEYIPLGRQNVPYSTALGPTAQGFAQLATINGVSQTNLNVLRQYMPPAQNATNFTTVGGQQIPIGPLQFSGKNWQNQYYGVGSLDWKIRNTDNLRARYGINNIDGETSGAALPTFMGGLTQRSQFANISEYHNLGANGINELRLTYNRFRRIVDAPNLLFPGLTVFPNISIQQDLNASLGNGFAGIGAAGLNTYALADNVNITAGRHNVRFGYSGRRYIGPLNFQTAGLGYYSFSNLQRFLFDQTPDIFGSRSFGNLTYSGNHWDHYAYLNDNWRVRPNLSINLGLRYEYVTIPQTLQLQALNAVASVPGVLEFREPDTQKLNFAPRVGIAFSPTSMQNTVFRAGFGMNYDAMSWSTILPSVPPGQTTTEFVQTITPVFGFFGSGALVNNFPVSVFSPSVTPEQARAMTTTFIPDQKLPYTMQWNANMEQRIGSFVLNVGYLGVKAVHLPTQGILNSVSAVTAERSLPLYYQRPTQAQLNALPVTLSQLENMNTNPLASFGFTSPIYTVSPDGWSWYNGLLVTGSQRFKGGLQFKAKYTWSHLIDNLGGPNLLNTSVLNSFNWRTPNSHSSIYDHRHVASLTALWDLGALGANSGFNWVRDILANMTISGTFTYATAPPIPLTSGFDAGLAGGVAPSGVFVNQSAGAVGGSGVTPLRNTSGQTVAYLANNANAEFVAAGAGTFPNGGNVTFNGLRPINNFDAAVFKRFAIRDRFALELHGEAYNLLNHPQFVPGSLNGIGLGSAPANWNLLVPGSTVFGDVTQAFSNHPRLLQVGLRFLF